MSLDDVLRETGDEILDFTKTTFKKLLLQAKNDSKDVIKETGEKVEKWMVMRANGDLDDDELEALLNTRKRTVRQFLLTQEINARSRLEKISIDMIDMVVNKLIGVVF
ncbi:hypothetical protein QUF74_01075 [Candidatus Halobeggiatoa sp. HSG11]|nr:hypothetical protein [Candidatus Halobeggiatoa sp. HSG11]